MARRLAIHETLELHELLAMNSINLAKHKSMVRKVCDPALKELYLQCITQGELVVRELASIQQSQLMFGGNRYDAGE